MFLNRIPNINYIFAGMFKDQLINHGQQICDYNGWWGGKPFLAFKPQGETQTVPRYFRYR